MSEDYAKKSAGRRLPLALRPWWSQRLASPVYLTADVQIRDRKPARASLQIQTTNEPTAPAASDSIMASPPASPQSGQDEPWRQAVGGGRRPVPDRRLATVRPPRITGQEHLADDESLEYSIDLVR